MALAKYTISIFPYRPVRLCQLYVLLFSGMWPPIKQLATVVLWVIPPGVLSVSRRGYLVVLLDSLGKWTLFGVFIYIVFVATIQVSIQSPPFLPSSLYKV